MPVTIKAGGPSGPGGDRPKGNVYPNNDVAIAFSPTQTFRGKGASSTGVFPDEALGDSAVADAFHIHQITYAGVVWKVSVTFLKKGDHVAWAFYEPDPVAAKTFTRRWSPSSQPDDAMKAAADGAFEEYIEGCQQIPALTANASILDMLNREAMNAKKLEEMEKAPVTAEVQDVYQKSSNNPFGKQAAPVSAPRADGEVEELIKKAKIKIPEKDLSMVRSALLKRLPKEEWNRFIKSYYDSIL